jgi:hypothetical protein
MAPQDLDKLFINMIRCRISDFSDELDSFVHVNGFWRNKLESLWQILIELGDQFRHFKHLFRKNLHSHVDILVIMSLADSNFEV